MSVERRQHAKRLFLDALDRPVNERAMWVAAACGTDLALRSTVESLVRAHEQVGEFLEAPVIDGAPLDALTIASSTDVPRGDAPSAAEETPGARLGPYRVLEPLGEGGCGRVHPAEQLTPVLRVVALKILRVGMDSEEVISRFAAERQTLAMMSHPNIATIFDAGTTDSGRSCFVMEHVPGLPINAFCDRHELSTVKRLELMVTVCGVRRAPPTCSPSTRVGTRCRSSSRRSSCWLSSTSATEQCATHSASYRCPAALPSVPTATGLRGAMSTKASSSRRLRVAPSSGGCRRCRQRRLPSAPDVTCLVTVGWHVIHVRDLDAVRRELADLGLAW